MVGVGAAAQIGGAGVESIEQVQRGWRYLLESPRLHAEGAKVQPILFGGFAFDPLARNVAAASAWSAKDDSGSIATVDGWELFPDGLLTLPRVLYRRTSQGASVTYAALLPSNGDAARSDRQLRELWQQILLLTTFLGNKTVATSCSPSTPDARTPFEAPERTAWQSLVAAATAACREHRLDKVVLARELRLEGTQPFDTAAALRRARASRPNGCVFAYAAGGHCFLGATPERLVRLRDGCVATAAVAGTRPRGGTAHDDAALAQLLLSSDKDRWEHTIVVESIRRSLVSAGVALTATPATTVMKTATVQHLYTPFAGRIVGGNILDLVAALHPTPAVGGHPTATALEWLRRHEGIDRGWYAGPVGWVDGNGNGDFAVAIRSALLHDHQASLFAGCGIVGDSDPEAEYAESCYKFRPMLAALGY